MDQIALFSRISLSSSRVFQKHSRTQEHPTSMKINMRIVIGTVSTRRIQICPWFNLIVHIFCRSNDLGFCNITSNQHYSSYSSLFPKLITSRCSMLNALQNTHKHWPNREFRILTLTCRQWRFGGPLRFLFQNRWTRSSKKSKTMLRINCYGF